MAPNNERRDYFDETSSDTESSRRHRDEQIRQAPYLQKVQIWARDDGPYTLRVGNHWYHCDDLVINGVEFGQGKNATSAQSRQQHKRPPSSRSQSYQRTRPDRSTPAGASSSQYQPQSLPTPKEQAEKRRAERRHHKDNEDKIVHRERRDSGTAMMDDQQQSSAGALVPYNRSPTTQSPPQPSAMKQYTARPTFTRRGSSRNGSYTIPVRSKGRKNVRFAVPSKG